MLEFTVGVYVETDEVSTPTLNVSYLVKDGPFKKQQIDMSGVDSLMAAREKLFRELLSVIAAIYDIRELVDIAYADNWAVTYEPLKRKPGQKRQPRKVKSAQAEAPGKKSPTKSKPAQDVTAHEGSTNSTSSSAQGAAA